MPTAGLTVPALATALKLMVDKWLTRRRQARHDRGPLRTSGRFLTGEEMVPGADLNHRHADFQSSVNGDKSETYNGETVKPLSKDQRLSGELSNLDWDAIEAAGLEVYVATRPEGGGK
jgi:hypothetical protein